MILDKLAASPTGFDCPPPPNPSSSTGDSAILEDQLAAILVHEQAYQVSNSLSQGESDIGATHDEWRRKICQWCFRVIDHFSLDREVVSHGLNIFDRFLVLHNRGQQEASGGNRKVNSRTYQLAAMTSLYLAIKQKPDNTSHEDGSRKKRYFKLSSFVELSRGQFCPQEICDMEWIILKTLDWKVNPPTPMALVSFLLCLMPPHDSIPLSSQANYDLVLHVLQELSRYLTELSVCLGTSCIDATPSQVAYAAILVSMNFLTYKALPLQVRNAFNAAIVMLSLQSEGTKLTPIDKNVVYLKSCLQSALLPEMLVDDSGHCDSCHPISMAKDFGLLDLAYINNASHKDELDYSNSPTRVDEFSNYQSSPITVTRCQSD